MCLIVFGNSEYLLSSTRTQTSLWLLTYIHNFEFATKRCIHDLVTKVDPVIGTNRHIHVFALGNVQPLDLVLGQRAYLFVIV